MRTMNPRGPFLVMVLLLLLSSSAIVLFARAADVGTTDATVQAESTQETAPSGPMEYGIQSQTDAVPYPEAQTNDEGDIDGNRPDELLPDGSLGRVSIPYTGLSAPIHAGTTDAVLAQGAGLWEDSSLNSHNVCLFGHNRGSDPWFFELKDTAVGDVIQLETAAGVRTFQVETVQFISSRDFSWLTETENNVITLISCVANRPGIRLMVRGTETPAEAT